MSVNATADVIVIGAGFAGGFTAHAFAKRGANVLILESESSIATKASGNRFALLTPYITTKPSPLETAYSPGFRFSSAFLTQHPRIGALFHRSGALQLPATGRLKSSLISDMPILGDLGVNRVSSQDASELSALSLSTSAFYIPDGGFIDPRALLAALLAHLSDFISTKTESRVTALTQRDNLWEVQCSRGYRYVSPTVVICSAFEASSLTQSSWLPLEPVRGQTVSAHSTPSSSNLRTVISFGGYVTPSVDGSHLIGAHYRHNDNTTAVSDDDTSEILAKCSNWLPAMQFSLSGTHGARVCFRTSTLDRLPYIGMLPHFAAMKLEASQYRSGTDLTKRIPLTYYTGLYTNVGHGSRGLLSCPMGGEMIARMATNEGLHELEPAGALTTLTRLPHRLLS